MFDFDSLGRALATWFPKSPVFAPKDLSPDINAVMDRIEPDVIVLDATNLIPPRSLAQRAYIAEANMVRGNYDIPTVVVSHPGSPLLLGTVRIALGGDELVTLDTSGAGLYRKFHPFVGSNGSNPRILLLSQESRSSFTRELELAGQRTTSNKLRNTFL